MPVLGSLPVAARQTAQNWRSVCGFVQENDLESEPKRFPAKESPVFTAYGRAKPLQQRRGRTL